MGRLVPVKVPSMSSEPSARDVIIADNDYIIRGILRSVLERQNFSVLPAVDGHEAINLAMRTKASLVILDYKMPKLDGFATCAEIRVLPGYAEVPIIILTAFSAEGMREAAEHAGATMFLTKPFRPVDLLQAIATLLGPLQGDDVPTATAGPAYVWKRQLEPARLYGEATELSEGRRILNICRR